MWDGMEIAVPYLALVALTLWVLGKVWDSLDHKNRM